jgi:hypothetical protein
MGSPTGRARPRVSAVHTMWWCYYRTGRVCRVVLTRAPAQFGDNHFWQERARVGQHKEAHPVHSESGHSGVQRRGQRVLRHPP